MKHYHLGFTLAELLIALSILGVISAFIIPKVIISQQDQKRKAIFRETISTVSSILNSGLQSGGITTSPIPPYTNSGTYILTHMNAVKVCDTQADTQGCWTQPYGISTGTENTEPGLILHNGATVAGLNNPGSDANAIVIDWNGIQGPNTEGDDQLLLNYCHGPTTCNDLGVYFSVGRILPSTNSTTLYNSIFQGG